MPQLPGRRWTPRNAPAARRAPEAFTDGTWLGGVAHIPNVALGGGDPLTAYHPDEHIGLEELQITCEMYRHLPLAFARSVESARS
jgi:acetylornithine deacetylase/succinyl-diaminopimelate desuccinylase-like protein